MKNLILFVIALLLSISEPFAQQTALAGRIYELNSRTRTGTLRYVAGAAVQAESAKPQTSDPLGRFGLLFVGKDIGEAVKVSVEKHGYEVANSRELESVALPRLDTLPVYVADPAYLAQEQAALLDIQTKVLTRELDALIAKLRSDSATSRRTLAELKERFQQDFQHYGEAEEFLHKRQESVKERLPERAAELARVNLDFASAQYLAAYERYRAGDMEAVIRMIDEDSLAALAVSSLEKMELARLSGVQYKFIREQAIESTRRVVECFELRADALALEFQYLAAAQAMERVLKLLLKLKGGQEDLELASSYSKASGFYWESANYSQASVFTEHGLRIRTRLLPPNHPNLAESYNNLSMIHLSMGDYPKAVIAQEKAITILQKALDPDHPIVASSFHNLASVYISMGDYPNALVAHEKALAIRQKVRAPDHLDHANSYNTLALIQRYLGNHPMALSAQEMAIAIFQKALAADHPTLASSYNNLAVIHQDMRDYPMALATQEQAISILQKTLVPDHPTLATSYNNLAMIHQSMSNYPKAFEAQEKAIAIFQKTFAHEHPTLGTYYHNLAAINESLGNYPKALEAVEKAIAIRQKALAPDHLDLANSYNNLAKIYKSMGEYPKALAAKEKAIAIQEKALAPDHPDQANSYSRLAMLHLDMDDFAKALAAQEKAISIHQKALAPNHADLANSYNNLATIHKSIGDYTKALEALEKAISIQEKELAPDHPAFANSCNTLSMIFYSIGDYPKALDLQEKVIILKLRTLSPDDPSLADSYHNIGYILIQMGQLDSAIVYEEKAWSIRINRLPLSHPHMFTLRTSLGLLYGIKGHQLRKKGDLERAIKTYLQAALFIPDSASIHFGLGICHYRMGAYQAAITAYDQAIALDTAYKINYFNNTALAYAKWGKTQEAQSRLTELQALIPDQPLPFRTWAFFHALQGDFPAALQSLEKAIDLGFNDRAWLDNEEAFNPLRDDPRYQALLKRMQP